MVGFIKPNLFDSSVTRPLHLILNSTGLLHFIPLPPGLLILCWFGITCAIFISLSHLCHLCFSQITGAICIWFLVRIVNTPLTIVQYFVKILHLHIYIYIWGTQILFIEKWTRWKKVFKRIQVHPPWSCWAGSHPGRGLVQCGAVAWISSREHVPHCLHVSAVREQSTVTTSNNTVLHLTVDIVCTYSL